MTHRDYWTVGPARWRFGVPWRKGQRGGELTVINLLQRSLDRRRVLAAGMAAGAAMALPRVRRRGVRARCGRASGRCLGHGCPDCGRARLRTRSSPMACRGSGRTSARCGTPTKAKYEIDSWEDTDMGSATEIAKFLAEKDNPVADIGDIGILFAPSAVQFGVARAVQERHLGRDPRLGQAP